MSPFARSKLQRHGLRKPHKYVSSQVCDDATNGLSAGIEYSAASPVAVPHISSLAIAPRLSTSMRSILPRRKYCGVDVELSQLVDVVSFGFFQRHSASQCVPLSWPPSPEDM